MPSYENFTQSLLFPISNFVVFSNSRKKKILLGNLIISEEKSSAGK